MHLNVEHLPLGSGRGSNIFERERDRFTIERKRDKYTSCTVAYLGFHGGCFAHAKILWPRPILLTTHANFNAATPILWCAILRIALSLH